MRRFPSGVLILLLAAGCTNNGSYSPGTTTISPTTITPGTATFDRRDSTGAMIPAPPLPLTAAETQLAVEVAMREIAARDLRAEGPLYFVDAEMLRDKNAPERRLARVTHYRYAGALTITTLVDLGTQRAVDQRTEANAITPLSAEEVEEARRIALADPRVQELLRPYRDVVIEPMLLQTRSREDPIFGRRVVDLLFRVGRDYLSGPQVRVDLNARTVTVGTRPSAAPHTM